MSSSTNLEREKPIEVAADPRFEFTAYELPNRVFNVKVAEIEDGAII